MSDADEPALDRTKVAAWHLYAVFLTRAFTYWDAVDRDTRSNRSKRGKRHD